MSTFVFGNGRSRLGFRIPQLAQLGTTVGCNAFYRDHMPDYLVAVDPPMIDEILAVDAHMDTKFYIESRHDQYWGRDYVNFVRPNFPTATMDSGSLATIIAAENCSDPIFLIGFDYVSDTSFQNNVYTGTINYKEAHAHHVTQATLDSWHYRTQIAVMLYPEINFIRVVGNGYYLPFELRNYRQIAAEQFARETAVEYTPYVPLYQELDTRRHMRNQVKRYRQLQNPSASVAPIKPQEKTNPYADDISGNKPRWNR